MAQRKQEREEARRNKLLRQQNDARLAYEKAMEELRKQQAALEKVSNQIRNALQQTNQPAMQMDVSLVQDIFVEQGKCIFFIFNFVLFCQIYSSQYILCYVMTLIY